MKAPMKATTSTLANAAYGIVRRRLLRGQLSLGQAVSRRKLAAELGMSFLPVSEALLRLEFEGLLESRPRAGTRVRYSVRRRRGWALPGAGNPRSPGREVVRRGRIEIGAPGAEAACRARRPARRMRSLADRRLYLGVHFEFHRRIAEGGRCRVLSAAIEQTNALSSTWFCVFPRPTAARARGVVGSSRRPWPPARRRRRLPPCGST